MAKVMGRCPNLEWLVQGLVAVVVSLGKVGLELQWEEFVGSAPTGRDQSYVPQGEPTFRRGGGPRGREKNVGVPGAGIGGSRLEEGVQGGGVVAAGLKGVEEPLPPGRVLSQREQALGALDALIQVLGPEIGPQVRGLVEGLLPQKPASPVPTTPTHAEVVALKRKGMRRWRRQKGGWRQLGLRF